MLEVEIAIKKNSQNRQTETKTKDQESFVRLDNPTSLSLSHTRQSSVIFCH
jgi:hypothetical protein